MTTENSTETGGKSLDMMLDEIRARLDNIEKQGAIDTQAFSDITGTLDAMQERLNLLETAGTESARVAALEPATISTGISDTDAEWIKYILGKYFFDDRPAVVAPVVG